MKFLKWITSWTWCNKTIQLISSLFTYIHDFNLVSETIYSNEFKGIIKRYLKVVLKRDWIGRLYGVINPIIDIDGKLDINNMVIELDDNNTNNDEQVRMFIYKQLQLISDLFKINKLYDYISCDIKRLDDYDNFLFVIDITSRRQLSHDFKKWFWQSLIYAIIGVPLYLHFIVGLF